jgi:glucokinase
MSAIFLVGDIGGTNSRFSLFQVEGIQDDVRKHRALYSENFKNEGYDHFAAVVTQFLNEASKILGKYVKPTSACFAVAGPVTNDRVSFTNRNAWIIDGRELELALDIPAVVLVNDFQANGYGVLTLKEEEYCVIQEASPNYSAPIACVGAGTGLGECFLTPSAGRYEAWPSEGGHVEFAPLSGLHSELLTFLTKKFNSNRVSVERVVSGKGLENIYEFLREKFPEDINPIHDERILKAAEGARLIGSFVYDDKLCGMAMDIMFELYGSEVGNVALKYLPYGGIYICGGIAPKNIERLRDSSSGFMKSFRNKGRVSPQLARIPVYVVLVEDLGLRGAHLVAYRLWRDGKTSIADETQKGSLDSMLLFSSQSNNFEKTSQWFHYALACSFGAVVASSMFYLLQRWKS